MGKTSLIGALLDRAPVPYVSGRNLAFPGLQPSGAEAQMRAMGAVGTLFAIVNRTSNATAQVEWKLYRKARSGREEDRVEVTAHAALDLWAKPNPFYTRQEFVESVQQHVDLTGEGWWVIARNPRANLPLELWPVRPDRMTPIPHPQDFLSGYMYTGPGGEQIALRLEDVIQLRMPNPLDPYRGMGPVQSILTDLDSSRFSAEWNRNFFRNGAEPGGIIQVDKRLSDDEFDEMTARWNEQHKGVANAHRVAVIEQGQWVDRKLSQRDMQFAELRSVSRDVIREAYGIPAFALGEVADVNRATAEASKAWFAEQLTVPRLERFKQALNNDLLPLYGTAGQGLEFDYCDPVPPNQESLNAELTAKANAAKALRDAGWDPDDILSAVGLPEMRYAAPPAPAAPPRPAPAPPAARLDIHHHSQPAIEPAVEAPGFLALLNLARTHRPTLLATAADTSLEEVQAQFDEALTQLLNDWDGIADDQYDELEQQIETAVDDGDVAALAALTVSTTAATTLLQGALGDMADTAAQQMADEAAAQGVDVTPPKVDEALRNRFVLRDAFGSELVEIAVATATLLGSDVAASAGREALRLVAPGATGRSIATQVTGFLRGLKNWFRRDQLGGALHRAQNTGRFATLEAAPTATYTASEKLDVNTCEPCSAIDGHEFTDLAAARAVYGAGGFHDCLGGIRCRGTVVATWEEQ